MRLGSLKVGTGMSTQDDVPYYVCRHEECGTSVPTLPMQSAVVFMRSLCVMHSLHTLMGSAVPLRGAWERIDRERERVGLPLPPFSNGERGASAW